MTFWPRHLRERPPRRGPQHLLQRPLRQSCGPWACAVGKSEYMQGGACTGDTHAGLLFLLGLGRVLTRGGSVLNCLGSLAVRFRLGELARDGFAATPAGLPLDPPLLLLLLISRLSDLDDQCTTVELLLVELVDGTLYGFRAVQGHEPIASRARPSVDDLGSDTCTRRELVVCQRMRCNTYMSSLTGAKNAFSPSSVVEYARLPTKTCGCSGVRMVNACHVNASK